MGTDLDVDGTAELDNITIGGAQGSDGQVLTSTGSGVAWEAVSSTASVATTVTITDNESTNEDNAIIFTAGGDVDGGNLGLESDGTLTYNPSTGKITATGFIGSLTGTADTATVATTVTITDNESTNEDNAIIFTAGGDVDGGNIGLESDGTLTYNPSTGKITATGFIGAIDGILGANSAAALTATTGVFSTSIDVTGSTGIILENDETITNSTNGTISFSGGIAIPDTGNIGSASDLDAIAIAANGNVTYTQNIYIKDDKKIIFGDGSDASLEYDEDGTNQLRISGKTVFDNDMEVADSKFLEFASAAGTPTTDNTVQGIVIEFLAVEGITQFDAVYVSTTTGRVGRADANDAAKLPAIGIAIETQGSAGQTVRVLTHGVYRDDGGFGSDMTIGNDLYVSETPGTLTTTAPSDTNDFVQIMGVAIGVRSAFINPDMTIVKVG